MHLFHSFLPRWLRWGMYAALLQLIPWLGQPFFLQFAMGCDESAACHYHPILGPLMSFAITVDRWYFSLASFFSPTYEPLQFGSWIAFMCVYMLIAFIVGAIVGALWESWKQPTNS